MNQFRTSYRLCILLSFFLPSFLVSVVLLALLDVVVEDVPEVVPAALRDQDGVPEVALDLGHSDVPALCVLLAGEEEVLVLDADVPVVGGRCRFLDLPVVVLLDELLEVEVELLHAVCGDEDLEAGVAPGERLGHLQEPTPGVL